MKLAENWNRFAELLLQTVDQPIVEDSRKDAFWGANPVGHEMLVGVNALGRLLMELRAELRIEGDRLKEVSPPPVRPAARRSLAWTGATTTPKPTLQWQYFDLHRRLSGRSQNPALGLLLKVDEMKPPRFGGTRLTENLEAFDDYLRAVEDWSRGSKAYYDNSRQWIDKVLDLDPKYAEAYAFLGWLHLIAAWNQWSENPLADLKHASELAQTAFALADTNSSALALLCDSDWMQSQHDQDVADGERAVAINPNYAKGYQALSDALLNAGRPQEAVRSAKKAMRLDPAHEDFFGYDLGMAYVQMARYDAAIQILRRDLAAYPNLPNQLVAYLALPIAYAELDRDDDARAQAAEIARISPGFTLASLTPTKDGAWNRRSRNDLRKAVRAPHPFTDAISTAGSGAVGGQSARSVIRSWGRSRRWPFLRVAVFL
jgi:tetratricopeptide (TPR) repeat protein